jgi:hypothetical protein
MLLFLFASVDDNYHNYYEITIAVIVLHHAWLSREHIQDSKKMKVPLMENDESRSEVNHSIMRTINSGIS